MVCLFFLWLLAGKAAPEALAAADSADLAAVALWLLCDIELFRLIFKK